MWSFRQIQIMEILLQHPDGIIAAKIGEKLSVSDRTVRNDIHSINQDLSMYHVQVYANNKCGYYLKNEEIPVVASLLEQYLEEQSGQEGIAREWALMGKVLFSESLPLDDLAEQLFVSEQSVYKDFIKLQAHLKQIMPELLFTLQRNAVHRSADEENVRKAFLLILKDEALVRQSMLCPNLISLFGGYFDEQAFKNTILMIKEIFENNQLVISDDALFLIGWAVCFCIVRNRHGYPLNKKNGTAKAHKKIIKMLTALKDKNPYYYENDIEFLDNFMWTLKLFSQPDEKDGHHQACSYVMADFCREVSHKHGLDLHQHHEMMVGLTEHVDYMLRRLEEGYEYDSPLKNMIKEKYIFAYEVAMLMVPIVFHHTGKYLLDGEVSYIAVYMAYYLERYYRGIRVVLVGRSRSGLTSYTEGWLRQNFAGQIEVAETLQTHQLQQYLANNNIDLILSLTNLRPSYSIPIYVINELPDHSDRARLSQIISEIQIGQTYRQAVEHKFTPELVFFYRQETTFEQVIRDLSCELGVRHYIEDSNAFIEDIIQREVNYPTLLSDCFMLPHPLGSFAKRSAVAVAVLKKPLKYHEKEIQLIFLLAAEDKEDEDIGNLFQLSRQIAVHREHFENLIHCQDGPQFFQALQGIALSAGK